MIASANSRFVGMDSGDAVSDRNILFFLFRIVNGQNWQYIVTLRFTLFCFVRVSGFRADAGIVCSLPHNMLTSFDGPLCAAESSCCPFLLGSGMGKREGYMKISTKGRYALRLMLDLAQHNTGEYISLKDISGRQDITVKYLEQIVTSLTRAGFLRSQRGNNGGYRLARNPAEYKVGEILRAMEGSLDPVNCDASVEDIRNEDFAVLPFWRGLSRVINQYVDSYTLEDLVDMAAEMAINTYMI